MPALGRSRSLFAEPLLWLALLIGLTRFWRLGEWSLWEDEVFTVQDARAVLDQGLAATPWNALGYWMFAGVVALLDPAPSEFGLRFLPALLGFAGILATALCFAPLFGPRRAAVAALLVAASSWHVYWSQNARFYTLAQDFVVIGVAFGLRAVFRPMGESFWRTSLLAVLFLGLAAATHPAQALLIPAWIGGAWICRRLSLCDDVDLPRLSRAQFAALCLLLAALGAWCLRVLIDYHRTKNDSTALHLIQTGGWYFTPALLAAAAFGSVASWRARRGRDVLLAMVCATSVVLAIAVAFFVRAAAQYLFALLPLVAVLATAPLDDRRAGSGWRAAWVAVLVGAGLFDQSLYFLQRRGDRPAWREAFAEVLERAAPGDLVFSNNANVGEWYFDSSSDDLRHPRQVQVLDRYSYATTGHWARQGRRQWFVFNEDRLNEWPRAAREAFVAMLAADARRVAAFHVREGPRDLDVLVYLRE